MWGECREDDDDDDGDKTRTSFGIVDDGEWKGRQIIRSQEGNEEPEAPDGDARQGCRQKRGHQHNFSRYRM